MPQSVPSLRAVLPLVAVGMILLLVSVFLVGRDIAFVRAEAESEVLAIAEVSATAIQFASASEVGHYLSGLVKHPAIATVTMHSSNGERTTRRRPPTMESSFFERVVPSLGDSVVACRALGSNTVCVEGDHGFYRKRLAALVIPHAILLSASALLLLVAIVLARGSNRQQIADLSRIVQGAAEESNFSLRAGEAKGQMGTLVQAINKLLEQMQQRDLILRRRTTELEAVNRELEAFSYSVSHDLRAPLASIDGFSRALNDFYGDRLDEPGKEYLKWIQHAVDQMQNLIAGLLQISRVTRSEISRSRIDLSAIARSIAETLRHSDRSREVDFQIEPEMFVDGDERLLRAVMENLMSNAFKFTRKSENARMAVGSIIDRGRRVYFVRDNGAGFDSTQAAKMFTAFQRFHSTSEFEGTGIGLATVKRIVERHGGAIWADGQTGLGATFYFTTGEEPIPGEQASVPELTRV